MAQSAREYQGKEDPANPENETDFKRAYNKVLIQHDLLIASRKNLRH